MVTQLTDEEKRKQKLFIRYEVLTVVNGKFTVFWDVTSCNLVDRYNFFNRKIHIADSIKILVHVLQITQCHVTEFHNLNTFFHIINLQTKQCLHYPVNCYIITLFNYVSPFQD
jgi:hypothetical protein